MSLLGMPPCPGGMTADKAFSVCGSPSRPERGTSKPSEPVGGFGEDAGGRHWQSKAVTSIIIQSVGFWFNSSQAYFRTLCGLAHMTDVVSFQAAKQPPLVQPPKSVPPALGFVLIAAGFLPLLVLDVAGQRAATSLVFPFLLWVAAGLVVWRTCRRLGPLSPGKASWSVGLLIGCWLALALAVLLVSPGLGAAVALLTLLVVVYAWGGGLLVWRLLPAWLLLWLAVPLPFGYDVLLSNSLRALAIRAGSEVVDLLGIHHMVQGTTLRFADQSFSIEPVLRGWLSISVVLAITLFGLLWSGCSRLRVLFVLAAAWFWTLVGNAAWVVVAAYAERFQKIEIDAGWNARWLSGAILFLTLFLILSTDALHRVLSGPLAIVRFRLASAVWQFRVQRLQMANMRAGQDPLDEEDLPLPPVHPWFLEPEVVVSEPTRFPALSQARFLSWPVVIGFGLLALAQWIWIGPCLRAAVGGVDIQSELGQRLAAETMPEKVGIWDRQSSDTHALSKGLESKDWVYQSGLAKAVVSVDFPIRGRQDLTERYRGEGWNLAQHQLQDGDDGPVLQSDLRRGPGHIGYLLQRQFGSDEKPIAQPRTVAGLGFWNWLRQLPGRLEVWNSETRDEQRLPFETGYRVAVFIESTRPLTVEERKEVQKLLDTASVQIRGGTAKSQGNTSS